MVWTLLGASVLHRGSCLPVSIVEARGHLRFPRGPSSGLTSMAIRKVRQRDKEKGCDAFLISIDQNTSIFRGPTRNSRRHTEIELNGRPGFREA